MGSESSGAQFNIISLAPQTDTTDIQPKLTAVMITTNVQTELESLASSSMQKDASESLIRSLPVMQDAHLKYEIKKANELTGGSLERYRADVNITPSLSTLGVSIFAEQMIEASEATGGKHAATFRAIKEYGDRAYQYIDDDPDIGNKVATALLDPESKIYLDEEGRNISMLEYLNTKYSSHGITLSYSYEPTPERLRVTNLNHAANQILATRTANLSSDMATGNPIPTININYSKDGINHSHQIPVYGIPTSNPLHKGGYKGSDSDKMIYLAINHETLISGGGVIVHEIDHAISNIISEALEIDRTTQNQDYYSVLNEGKVMLAEH